MKIQMFSFKFSIFRIRYGTVLKKVFLISLVDFLGSLLGPNYACI